jgi:hypothetical protein
VGSDALFSTPFGIWIYGDYAYTPSREIETPAGDLNCELDPIPFVEPVDPATPAMLETEAVVVIILRIT